MSLISIVYKGLRGLYRIFDKKVSHITTKLYLAANNVVTGRGLKSYGIPIVDIWNHGSCKIGDNFKMNNGNNYNRIGRQQKCFFIIGDGGELIIGDNVGISSTAFVCYNRIVIGNNVKIGGNTVIYDSDFHSLNSNERADSKIDKLNIKTKPVIIGNDVFIGAHTTILKGVSIGDNSIIGACSVITKNIPSNEIWAGNPAKFLKSTING